MDLNKVHIKTPRLLLVPITNQYLDIIFKEFNEQITVFMYPKPAKQKEETQAFIELSIESMEKGKNLQLVILKKSDQEFLGCAGLHEVKSETPELGIWIKQSAQGNRYGLEAIQALKQWVDETLHHKYLLYPVDQDNLLSRKIPEALGGKIGRSYSQESQSGKTLNVLEYRIYSS